MRPQSGSVSSDCESFVKQLLNRLSATSNCSSLSSRHNSTSSTKITTVAHSVHSNDINCTKNEAESRVKGERKVLCSKCDRQIYNDMTGAHLKSKDKEKRKGSSIRNNCCIL